jgi:hypothetical protein
LTQISRYQYRSNERQGNPRDEQFFGPGTLVGHSQYSMVDSSLTAKLYVDLSILHRAKSQIIKGYFFLSGLAGLIYEVVSAHHLGLFLGIASYAHTAVITA